MSRQVLSYSRRLRQRSWWNVWGPLLIMVALLIASFALLILGTFDP